MSKRIFISGSLAYDRIMDFPGRFADHIMPDKIHMLNVSFTVNSLVERTGGTAGNIAYALALLGERPIITATIGHDYQRYFDWLERQGIPTNGVKIIADEFTAGAYITTDQADNQITAFNPGAMKYTSDYDLADATPEDSIGIISPGNVDDMIAYRNEFHRKGIDFVFDPGQSLPIWEPAALADALGGARVLIANDYEMEMIMNRTSLSKAEIQDRVGAIITTKGEEGSIVSTASDVSHVAAVKLSGPPIDPTGAGDAYRGGLIKGMITGKDLVESARLGSICGSYAVEVHGTQTYRFTAGEFQQRYQATYG